jgi:hypothetical protein
MEYFSEIELPNKSRLVRILEPRLEPFQRLSLLGGSCLSRRPYLLEHSNDFFVRPVQLSDTGGAGVIHKKAQSVACPSDFNLG